MTRITTPPEHEMLPADVTLAPFTPDWLANPDFDHAGKVHDWRNYVGRHTREIWSSLHPMFQFAIAQDADERASGEDWD